MSFRHHKVKKDANHKDIVDALVSLGCAVTDCAALKNEFDILVGYKGKLHIMEIKDGNKPKSARKLTDGELKCMDKYSKVGIKYNVVLSVEDAIKIIMGEK